MNEDIDTNGVEPIPAGKVAEMFGITKAELKRLERQGLIRPVYPIQGKRRYSADEILRMLRQMQEQPQKLMYLSPSGRWVTVGEVASITTWGTA